MPTPVTYDLTLLDQHLRLDPRRAIAWPAQQTLLIADPHFGKADHFRRAGIPVPDSVAKADFDRLAELLQDHAAERLVVLGDFFHARQCPDDASLRQLADWRDKFTQLDVLIVKGNHDQHAGAPPANLRFTSVNPPYQQGPFVYRHLPIDPHRFDTSNPADPTVAHIFAGHLHPGVTVELGPRSAKRVACFFQQPHQTILPAFGRFTGTAKISPQPRDRVFAVTPSRVLAIPHPAMI